jgi:hypothetical protein
MRKIYTICFLFSIVYHIGFSQGYFPLQAGNQWDFGDIITPGYQYLFSIKVLGDTIMSNSKTYAIVLDPYHNSGDNNSYKRQEGSILYDYTPTGDIIEHDFTYKNGDTTARYPTGNDTIITIVSVGFGEQFGRNLKFWNYEKKAIHNIGYEHRWWTITDSLGYTFFGVMGNYSYCMGIKIDGQIYGTITQVSVEKEQLPNQYQLFQNYPNPFNPATKIEFETPITSFITLKIFDFLGRELTTLVSEELEAGHHSRIWNASNYSSGVYFYSLQSGKYSQTKKLILQK